METNGQNKDIETIEPDIETLPESGGIVDVSTSRTSIEDQLFLAENIDKLISAQNKIRLAILKLAQAGDWVVFGNKDVAKAEIGFAGAMRIGSTLGISFVNWEAKKDQGTDDKGDWYRWEYECDAEYRGRRIRVYGRAGSRDKFFGKVKGVLRPLDEIDEGNIKMAARRASMKEGVKVFFGLHHLDPEYLKQHGISLVSAGGHDFKTEEQKEKAVETVNVGIENVTAKKGTSAQGKPYTRYTILDIEGGSYSTFSETFANLAKQLKESKKLATIEYIRNGDYLNIETLREAGF